MNAEPFTPEHGHCTCHQPPRPMTLAERDGEWGHDDDETFAEVRHVHVNVSSSDCDGPHEHSVTYTIPMIRREALVPWHRADADPDFDDLWRYLSRSEPPTTTSYEATITVTPGHVHWSETTDEGGSGGEAYVCDATYCAFDPPRQRDIYAEQMGY